MTIRRFALIALFLSAVSFVLLMNLQSYENWCPVRLPFPGQGLEVAWPFNLATAGKFRLEVTLPRVDPSGPPPFPEPPAINCDIQLEVKNPDGSTVQQSIKWLNSGAGYPIGHLDNYTAEPVALTRSGMYIFHLRNQGRSEFLSFQGAGIAFIRQTTESEDWIQRGLIFGPVGLALLFLGIMAALVSEVQDYRKRHAIGEGSNPSGE